MELNGEVVARCESAFYPVVVDVTSKLYPAGSGKTNSLSIVFDKALDSAAARAAAYPYKVPYVGQVGALPDWNHVRKAASDFGWDWGPAFAPVGVAVGVSLEVHSSARLVGATVRQTHDREKGTVDVHFDAILRRCGGRADSGTLVVSPVAGKGGLVAPVVVRAVAGAVVRGHDRLLWRSSLLATLVALLAAWALPLYEQVTGAPRGNISELWLFFVKQTRPGQTLPAAVSAWADMLSGVLRPDFYVAHGWPFVESPVLWAEWATLGALALVVLFAWRGLRRRDHFDTALGGLLLLGAAMSLWSTTRIAETIFDHDIFWMAAIGALMLAVAADVVLSSLGGRLVTSSGPAGRVACALLISAAAAAPAGEVDAAARRSTAPTAEAGVAQALASDLETYLVQQGISRPLVKIDQEAWGVAAGAILALQKRGTIVSVEEDWVVMFTPAFRATGREDAVITVAMPPEHLRLAARGVRTISSHGPIYAHAERPSVK